MFLKMFEKKIPKPEIKVVNNTFEVTVYIYQRERDMMHRKAGFDMIFKRKLILTKGNLKFEKEEVSKEDILWSDGLF